MTLHLTTPADVEAVLGLLGRTPGARADVRVQWDGAKKKYVARACASRPHRTRVRRVAPFAEASGRPPLAA
jgi:hypothetical protein